MKTALDYLDDLKDDAAVHIWPDDLAKCQTSECVVSVYSVRMGSPDGKTVPLFSREQVQAALQWQAEQQKGDDGRGLEACATCGQPAASPHGVPPGYVLAAGGAAREADREAMRMALEALKEAKFVLDFATAAMIVPADADGPVAQIPAAIKALEQRVGES